MRPLIIPIFIPFWGCRQRCVFCDQRKITGQGGARVDGSQIHRIIESHLLSSAARPKKFSHAEVAFYGGTFTALPVPIREGLLAAVGPYLKSGRVRSIRVSTRPDAIDHDVLSQLQKFGVTTIELGAQSMDDEVLARSGRGYGREDVRKASAQVKAEGFGLGLQLMPGLPGDDWSKSMATIDESIELRPNFIRIYPTTVIEGTELASMYRRGEYKPLGIEEAVALCVAWMRKLRKAKIRVIRIGLHPSILAEDSGFIAGPYHPAFRHLVQSDLSLEIMLKAIEQRDIKRASGIVVKVPSAELSDYIGHRRRNLERLRLYAGLEHIEIDEDASLLEGFLMIQHDGGTELIDTSALL